MQQDSKRLHKYKINTQRDEEFMTSCLASLLLCLSSTPTDEDLRLSRVLHKFTEVEKADRLAELHEKYASRVDTINKSIEEIIASRADEYQDYDAADDEFEFEEMRLEAGLATLQRVDIIIGFLATAVEQPELRPRLEKLLKMQGSSLDRIATVIAGTEPMPRHHDQLQLE
jgi:hypothetical protein